MPPIPEGWNLSPFQRHCKRWERGCGAEECERARKVVLARGKLPADILFLGEAPGENEDRAGKPFVGPAGELLQRIIDNAVPSVVRYVITNVVGCMPTNEDGEKEAYGPTQEQLYACSERLKEFVKLANPKLIVAVGKVAEDWIDHKRHHRVDFHCEIPSVSIKHPAAILREEVIWRGLSIQTAIVTISNALVDLRIYTPE